MRTLFLTALMAATLTGQSAPSRVGISGESLRLTLHEATEMALKNNLEIELERTNTAVARAFANGARGAFDPLFRYTPLAESRTTPTASVLQAADGRLVDRLVANNFSFIQRLTQRGATARVDFENARTSTSNQFVSLNPFTLSRLVLSYSQPLARGRKIDRDRQELRVRRKQVEISSSDFQLRLIDLILRVEQAYWDLAAAREDASVKGDTVEWARLQVERTRRMIASGTLAAVELPAATAEYERRRDTWYASLEAVTLIENNLKNLLAGGRAEPIWSREVLPAETQMMQPPAPVALNEAVADALKRRVELKSLGLREQTVAWQKELAADQLRPQVNLLGSYANSGVAGSVRQGDNPFGALQGATTQRLNELSVRAGLPPLPPVNFGALPPSLVGGYGTVLSNVFGGNYPTLQVGLTVDWTPRNRAAEAGVAQAVIGERQLKLERARFEQAIEVQVRNSLQSIETARQRIAAAEASARAAGEKLASEERLFENGESTNFLVLTRQNEYADSRRREVAARLDLNKAASRLQQALGQTLEAHGVALVP
ncbi:MAG: TolC family protein [Acidobacteria bacterium]|nr:TolC family protein [Acidobacteriota bacterium]